MSRLLVVEDDQMLRKNLLDLLEGEGYETYGAENGKVGLKIAKDILPDLILCDIVMPVMDGFELLDELQKDNSTKTIPFVFLTGKVEREYLRRGMDLGADDYLFKPFDIQELLNVIKARLKKKEIAAIAIKSLQEQIALKLPHELRTPLVPILGYSSLIEDENDINKIKEMVRSIKFSGRILYDRIEKFLLYKDLIVNQNIKDYLNTNISTLITDESFLSYISTLNAELNPLKRIKLNIEPQPVMICEPLLKQLVKELIENGLKFSEPDKKVLVNGHKSKDYYIIDITDNGKGMSPEEIKSVTAFNKFGEKKLSEAGLGLGLAIVKKITELYNGYLLIKSKKNKFTTCIAAIHL